MEFLLPNVLESGIFLWPPVLIALLFAAGIQLLLLCRVSSAAPKWILPVFGIIFILAGEITWQIFGGFDRILSLIAWSFGAHLLIGCLLAIPLRALIRRYKKS